MMNDLIHQSLVASGNSVEIDADTGRVRVRNEAMLRSHGVDALVFLAVFGEPSRQTAARWLLWETAQSLHIRPASIYSLYTGRGQDRLSHTFTTPAINLRMMTYDVARAAFRAAIKGKVGALIFELARSEMIYTQQRPAEYTAAILAAAIKEGFRGPLFLQGDHFQVNAARYIANTDAELTGLRQLVNESLKAGFYNIEFDTSTLVNLSRPTLAEQQEHNYEMCALLSDYVRAHQPAEITASIGGEIGELGDKNSNVHELRVFMDHYKRRIHHHPGLSKLSVHMGTSRGGVVLPDGSIAPVVIDFETLMELSTAARREYGMGGVVQHGVSTLPDEALRKFVAAGAIEVHLATGFQNLLFEHLPDALVAEMRMWLQEHAANERRRGDTEEQFFYKTRRLASGPFKKQLWNLPEEEKSNIRNALEQRFAHLFKLLGVEHTRDGVGNVTPAPEIRKRPEDFSAMPFTPERVKESTET
jgi:fructose/tagatose bisphosphate aldolase